MVERKVHIMVELRNGDWYERTDDESIRKD